MKGKGSKPSTAHISPSPVYGTSFTFMQQDAISFPGNPPTEE
jgi:hypothetical protein